MVRPRPRVQRRSSTDAEPASVTAARTAAAADSTGFHAGGWTRRPRKSSCRNLAHLLRPLAVPRRRPVPADFFLLSIALRRAQTRSRPRARRLPDSGLSSRRSSNARPHELPASPQNRRRLHRMHQLQESGRVWRGPMRAVAKTRLFRHTRTRPPASILVRPSTQRSRKVRPCRTFTPDIFRTQFNTNHRWTPAQFPTLGRVHRLPKHNRPHPPTSPSPGPSRTTRFPRSPHRSSAPLFPASTTAPSRTRYLSPMLLPHPALFPGTRLRAISRQRTRPSFRSSARSRSRCRRRGRNTTTHLRRSSTGTRRGRATCGGSNTGRRE